MHNRPSRPLGTFERAQALTGERFGFNLVMAVRLAGELEPGALRRALDRLQGRHALLRSRITATGRRPRFEAGAVSVIPLQVLDDADGEAWKSVVEAELLNRFVDDQVPLARCTWLPEPTGGASHLVLTLHHAIVDGQAVLHLLRELVASCAGADDTPRASALPPSADTGFPDAFRAPRCWPASIRFVARQIAEEASFRRRHRGSGPAPSDAPYHCRILPLAWPEETRALVAATRRARVGMTSALNAAMLLAIVRHRYGGGENLYRYFVMPDLRAHLKPPVAAEVVASHLSMIRLAVTLGGDSDLWHLAGQIHVQIDRATKRGERFLAARWGAISARAALREKNHRMSTIAMNYTGAVPLETTHGPLTIDRLHAFVTNFPSGPEYTAQARIFRRRLWWDIVFLDVDMDASQALAVAETMREVSPRRRKVDGVASAMSVAVEEIAAIVAQQLGIDQVESGDRLLEDLDASSADVLNIIVAVEDSLSIAIGEEEAATVSTVGDLHRLAAGLA